MLLKNLQICLRMQIKIRLRADVPVGAYLSGGLDSTVTTSLINEINPGILNTFSIGFKDKTFDETAYQLEAAKYFNTNHTAFECTSEEIAGHFVRYSLAYGIPGIENCPHTDDDALEKSEGTQYQSCYYRGRCR